MHRVKNRGPGLIKVAADRTTRCSLVTATIKLRCNLAAIQFTAAAKADLVDVRLLLDQDHGCPCSLDREGQIDQVLGIAREGTGLEKISQPDMHVSQPRLLADRNS